MEPVPPFIVFDEADDLYVFQSIDQIDRHLEGIDVEDGVYQVFDSKCSKIVLQTTGVKRTKYSVDIGHINGAKVVDASQSQKLRQFLYKKLHELNAQPVSSNLSLEELISPVLTKYS